MVTRAATKANAIANRMRQIRDRSNPATRARSASRVARRIYAMATGDEFTKTDLVTAVLACPQCGETSLFNTNWHRELTAFWSFGTARLTALLEKGEHDRWRLLMKGDPSCGFCERLRNNDPEAIVEAVAYTNENFPDINDDPPIL